MRKPKIGVVGLGGIAKKAYLPILTNSTSFELIGAFSPTVAKREAICRAYRMESFAGLPELATSVDAAFVHSSNETHYDVVSSLIYSIAASMYTSINRSPRRWTKPSDSSSWPNETIAN